MSTSSNSLKAGDHLFLVDGSTYIFRAFHALPPLTRKSDGLPVGAVSGFCNMLWKLLRDGDPTNKEVTPTHIGVTFDYSATTFRNEIYQEYKANRPEPPEELRPQFGIIRDAVRAFNVCCIEQEGWEADDLIATYAVQAVNSGADVTIISSDKDLMQLVRPGIVMVDTMKDRRIEAPQVVEKFGVPPEKVIEVQALAGDSTDNIPGVPGIGIKTAAELIQTYGDLETLLARAGEIKQNKRRENLIEFAEQARISQKLVTLSQEVPLDIPIEDTRVQNLDGKQAIAFLKAMEFSTLTKRVAAYSEADIDAIEPADVEIKGWEPKSKSNEPLLTTDGSTTKTTDQSTSGEAFVPDNAVAETIEIIKKIPLDTSKYEAILKVDELQKWIDKAKDIGIVAIDTETTSKEPMRAELVGVSLAVEPGHACYIPLQHRESEADLLGGNLCENQIPLDEALKLLAPMLTDPSILKIAQNLKYDLVVLKQYGLNVEPYDDTMLLSYSLDAGLGRNGMDELSKRWLDHSPISFKDLTGTGKSQITFDLVPIEKATQYAAEDADITLRLWNILKPRLACDHMTSVYETLERPMVTVLANMEERGIEIDRGILTQLSNEFAQGAAVLEDEIHKIAGEKFNVGSPKQLGEILFDKMNLHGDKKTSTGARSTGVDVMEELAAEGHEIAKKVLDWRQLSKLKSTYSDALPEFIQEKTKRVHTSFALAATTTGRLSSSDPNLQNIPIRTEEGRKIRRAFISPPGKKLVSADYSQIELRILAHLADIPQLRKAFKNNVDIHALTASEMFNVPVEGMDPMVRRRAKAINFGIIYGISAFGLANQLGIPRTEAGDYIKKYFERFPGIRDYMESTKKFARETGYVETIFGRKAHYPNINAGNFNLKAFNERAAINAPIQGSAADIIRRAMIRMDEALAKKKLAALMLLQVHDELIFEVPDEQVDETIEVVKEVMVNATLPVLKLEVELQVDARAADNWVEAH